MPDEKVTVEEVPEEQPEEAKVPAEQPKKEEVPAKQKTLDDMTIEELQEFGKKNIATYEEDFGKKLQEMLNAVGENAQARSTKLEEMATVDPASEDYVRLQRQTLATQNSSIKALTEALNHALMLHQTLRTNIVVSNKIGEKSAKK